MKICAFSAFSTLSAIDVDVNIGLPNVRINSFGAMSIEAMHHAATI